ncbi:MAG: hypothetical protein B5M53_01175 [Candidatus Cloacimonas sp. 4484_209]|nr:MAG: hypothetical protein B5M53_01175 [Candidatus Cloacimonas sp. 4484_209]
MIKTFKELQKQAKKKGGKRLVVACAEDKIAIEASLNAMKEGLVIPIFVGNKKKILNIARHSRLDVDDSLIEDVKDGNAVKRAVEIMSKNEGDILLKGMVKTSVFLKGILDKEIGLRTGRTLSHTAILEVPGYHKLLQFTDGGMNVKPDIETKIDIIKNAYEFAKSLGIAQPKVALLAAVETINPEMQETIDAAIIKQMVTRGQLGDIILDGPLALDLAVSKEACQIKGINTKVGGDADILVVPDIASGNISAKSLIYLAGAKAAGIILGARTPVVMLSRADDAETKLNSIALGVVSC